MDWTDVPWEATRAPEPPAPPLAALLAAGPSRREAVRHHVTGRLAGAMQTGMHHLFRVLPAAAGSHAAAAVVKPLHRWRYRHKPFVARMDGTVARLRPDLCERERAALLRRWFENTARTFADYASLDALARPRATAVSGGEHLDAARASGRPVVVTFVHTASWELLLRIVHADAFPGRTLGPWQPQPSRHENRIVWAARRRYGGKMLPPGPTLARSLLRFLSVPGQCVVIAVDEVSEKAIKFPLFGRALPERCNLSFALRAAARAGAIVLPASLLRAGPARFSLAWHPPVEVGEEDPVATGAAALEAVYAPLVLANLDQWYMLQTLRL